jgi:CheY-like chemotaxis protein
MNKKYKCVLLVDDDEATNFINRLAIRKAAFAEKIVIVRNGLEALEYLRSEAYDREYVEPDFIFLDINMPVMNGWEFLEAYQQLQHRPHAPLIVMLTTSLNPDDAEKAGNITAITEFRHKPLTISMLQDILAKYQQTGIAE